MADTPQLIFFEVEDLRDDPSVESIITDRIYYVLHDGSFDVYDYGQAASDELAWFAGFGAADQLLDQAAALGADVSEELINFPSWEAIRSPLIPPPPVPGGPTFIELLPSADGVSNPYFSFFTRVYPSDDAFIANEDPMRFRLFDAQGQFQGPFVIDVYGSEVLDAGTQINDEANLLIADIRAFDFVDPDAPLRSEDGVVQFHPGFIGSVRSKELEPGRLLTDVVVDCLPAKRVPGVFLPDVCRPYAPTDVDFTEPNSPLFRIRINASSRVIHGSWSGTYFDPERSGEGFNFEFFDDQPDRVTLFWYSYASDDSGRQQWLIGQGEKVLVDFNPLVGGPNYDYEIELFMTAGGRLSATSNVDDVELTAWGSARLMQSSDNGRRLDQQAACERLVLYDIQPLDDSIALDLPLSDETGLPRYELQRIGPQLSGLESFCGRRTFYPF